MRKALLAVLVLLAPVAARAADLKGTPVPAAPIVFFDIAGPDQDKQRAFYAGVFGWTIDAGGAIKNAGLDGTLRKDPTDKIIYLGVPDVAAALAQVTAAGGTVIMPRFEVKGVVVIGLFKDPAGNSMGLVETKDGKPVVP
ncbi:MAG: VOC family protein [Rhizomicrobium sp.]